MRSNKLKQQFWLLVGDGVYMERNSVRAKEVPFLKDSLKTW